MDKISYIWNSKGSLITELKCHTQPITNTCWQPLHLYTNNHLVATCSKNNSIRVYNILGQYISILNGNTAPIIQVKWSGNNIIYTAGRDRIIRAYNPLTGEVLNQFKGHGHWINTLSLNTDYIITSGPFSTDIPTEFQ